MSGRPIAPVIVLVVLGVAPVAMAEDGPPDAGLILSYESYLRLAEKGPLALEYASGEGRLLMVGVAHTLEFNSDTVGDIWRAFDAFKPTLAFYEGWSWPMGADQATVGRYGEPAVVRFLAYVNRVPITSLEPEMAYEVDHLRTRWSDEQIRLFYTLRFVAEGTGYGGQATSDAAVLEFLTDGFPGNIGGSPSSIAELEAAYRKYFPGSGDWRIVPVDWFDPAGKAFFTNEMAAASGRYRDSYMLPRLVERVRRGDRVFVAVGHAHVRMLEPALTAALGEPVRRPDDP